MARKTSLFFSELYWLEKNQKLEEDMFDCEDDFDYNDKKQNYQDRLRNGPVPVYYSNGSFKEVSVQGYGGEFNMIGVPSYDEMRRKAKSQLELDLWDECERVDQEEQCEVEQYSIIRPEIFDMMMKESEGRMDEIPDYNFGLVDNEEFSNLVKEIFPEPEIVVEEEKDVKEEIEMREMKVRTAYDSLLLYMYLYSLGEVKREISNIDEILRVVSEYYVRKHITFIIEDKIPISIKIKDTIRKYLDSYFCGGGSDLRQIGLIPHALFFLTSSIDKYKDVFELFEKQRFAVFRAPLDVNEIQGDFIQVSMHKILSAQSKYSCCVIEDTALGLDRFDYIGATYIKEFFNMGSVRFYDEFKNCKTLWVSTCVGVDRFGHYYISVYGTCGYVGPPCNVNVWSFNSINYVDGKCVGQDLERWPIYHPRRKAMNSLILMMNRRKGGVGAIRCKFKDRDKYVRDAYLSIGFHGSDIKARKFFDNVLSQLER